MNRPLVIKNPNNDASALEWKIQDTLLAIDSLLEHFKEHEAQVALNIIKNRLKSNG